MSSPAHKKGLFMKGIVIFVNLLYSLKKKEITIEYFPSAKKYPYRKANP